MKNPSPTNLELIVKKKNTECINPSFIKTDVVKYFFFVDIESEDKRSQQEFIRITGEAGLKVLSQWT
jgi:hypothetical protein